MDNNNYNQQNYGQSYQQQEPYNQYNTYSQSPGPNGYSEADIPISTGSWFVTILLCGIPIVNIVMLLIWAFSSNTQITKRNWARAQLIWVLIAIVLEIVLLAIWGSMIMYLLA